MCLLLISALAPHLVQALCVLPLSLWVHMCIFPAVFGRTVCPWGPHSLCLCILFMFLLLLGFLIPEGRNVTETFHLGLSVPFFAPYIMSSCGFLYLFLPTTGGNFSDNGCARYWSINIAECHWEFLFLIFICSFSRTIEFGFPLDSWTI